MKPHYYIQFFSDLEYEPRHENLESAQKAAEELAENNPGDHIEILKCVGITSCAKASTFWADEEDLLPIDEKRPEEEPAKDPREFEFYTNKQRTTFWRIHNNVVDIGYYWGLRWDNSSRSASKVKECCIKINADELPEDLV